MQKNRSSQVNVFFSKSGVFEMGGGGAMDMTQLVVYNPLQMIYIFN